MTKFIFRYLLSVHLCGLVFFSLFRIILYAVNIDRAEDVENRISMLLVSLGKGLQFDNFIASYISILPLLALNIAALAKRIPRLMVRLCNLFYIILYSLAFIIFVSDIPYFRSFFSHLRPSALEWFSFGSDTVGMILGDASTYVCLLLLAVSVTVFSILVLRFGKKLRGCPAVEPQAKALWVHIPATVLLLLVCLAGMRGTFQRYPLRIGYAYFSNNAFFNQLGVNPVFHFIKSGSGKVFTSVGNMMTVDEAVDNARRELGISGSNGLDANPPLKRFHSAEGEEKKANVVIILMESMSSARLEYEYKGRSLTPFLHQMIEKSYYFENFYSSGIHTNNGIVSSLYGFPALFNRPMMGYGSPVSANGRAEGERIYKGLPWHLQSRGYENLFFITGNPNYDHMQEFLYNNGFDRIYSQYDYPSDKVVNNFGVQDDYLFEYGLSALNSAASEGKPFLATFLTVSNHMPIVVPPEFEQSGDTDEKRILAFADNSIRLFMEGAQKEDWYSNTVFVLLGDHGSPIGQTNYDMFLAHNHIPCIIYSPLFDDMPRRFRNYGGQIDLFPTILGLLNMPFENNSPGVDLVKGEPRPCMFFVTDSQLGCIDDDYFYVLNTASKSEFLYDRRREDAHNIASERKEIKEKLSRYALSMIITSEHISGQQR